MLSLIHSYVDVNLEPLLFLKSLNAVISLTDLNISSIANCITSDDTLEISCLLDTTCLRPNRVNNKTKVSVANETKLIIHLDNVTATNSQLVCDYLNLKLANINTFLIQRLSLSFFDKIVFKNDKFFRVEARQKLDFNADEIALIKRYSDAAFFARSVFHNYLAGFLPDADIKLPRISYNNLKPYLSLEMEEDILNNSDLFLSIEERKKEESSHFLSFLRFEDFYNTDLTRTSAKREALRHKLTEDCETYLSLVLGSTPVREQLSQEDLDYIMLLMEDNIALLEIGFKLNQILGLQLSTIDANFSSSLLSVCPVTISVDPFSGKAIFHLNSQAFLIKGLQTSITVVCSSNVAYTLGLPNGYLSLTIGPLSITNPSHRPPLPLNQITNTQQRLPSAIRFHAKLIHIATDLLCQSETRDQWLVASPYESFHVIYTQLLDSECLENRFIGKSDSGQKTHKLMRSANIFHAIRFILLDENCRRLSFARETIVNLGLQISPLMRQDV